MPTLDRSGTMELPVIVLGGGGHAKVLMDILASQDRHILGYTDPDDRTETVLGIARMGSDEVIDRYRPDEVDLVNGLGSTSSTAKRRQLYERFRVKGYRFASVIHAAAVVASDVEWQDGVQIMAGVVIQPGSRLGANTIINTSASIDHDCRLGAHVHVAPGATLSGGVHLGDGVHVGTGASIIQGIIVGANSLVGAGAVVVNNVPGNVTVAGVPAKVFDYHCTS